jgi:hypothetical protein
MKTLLTTTVLSVFMSILTHNVVTAQPLLNKTAVQECMKSGYNECKDVIHQAINVSVGNPLKLDDIEAYLKNYCYGQADYRCDEMIQSSGKRSTEPAKKPTCDSIILNAGIYKCIDSSIDYETISEADAEKACLKTFTDIQCIEYFESLCMDGVSRCERVRLPIVG